MGHGSTDGILPPSRIDLREIAIINVRNGGVSNFIFICEKKIRGQWKWKCNGWVRLGGVKLIKKIERVKMLKGEDGRILFCRRPFAGICVYSRGFITATRVTLRREKARWGWPRIVDSGRARNAIIFTPCTSHLYTLSLSRARVVNAWRYGFWK